MSCHFSIFREERQKRKEEKEEEKRRKEEERKLADLKRQRMEASMTTSQAEHNNGCNPDGANHGLTNGGGQNGGLLLGQNGDIFDSMQVEFDVDDDLNMADVEDGNDDEDDLDDDDDQDDEDDFGKLFSWPSVAFAWSIMFICISKGQRHY